VRAVSIKTIKEVDALRVACESATETLLAVGEMIRAEHRGKAVGAMQSGWAIGWGVAAILATLFFSVLPPEIAWRALFRMGMTPALLVFFDVASIRMKERTGQTVDDMRLRHTNLE